MFNIVEMYKYQYNIGDLLPLLNGVTRTIQYPVKFHTLGIYQVEGLSSVWIVQVVIATGRQF